MRKDYDDFDFRLRVSRLLDKLDERIAALEKNQSKNMEKEENQSTNMEKEKNQSKNMEKEKNTKKKTFYWSDSTFLTHYLSEGWNLVYTPGGTIIKRVEKEGWPGKEVPTTYYLLEKYE